MLMRKSSQFIKLALVAVAIILGVGGLMLPKNASGLQEPAKLQGGSAEISFSKDIVPLFKEQKCTVCHRGENPSGLDLVEDVYKHLVSAKSTEDKDAVLVKPGDPDASYLYQKLIGPGKDGTIMPPKGKIEDAELNKVVQWIKQGAKDN